MAKKLIQIRKNEPARSLWVAPAHYLLMAGGGWEGKDDLNL